MVTLKPAIQEKLKIIVAGIKEVIPGATVYLFGSYARGEETPDSDLDIYVTTPDKSRRCLDWSIQARYNLMRRVRMPMDLLVNYEDNFNEDAKSAMSFEHSVLAEGLRIG